MPSTAYLVRSYEELQRDIEAFDTGGDVRKLVLALELACEALNAIAVDDDILARLENADFRAVFDIEELLAAERHLLTQAGMAPRYVAILLNDVELAERVYLVAGDPQQRQAQLPQLRGSVQALAGETCDLWRANKGAVSPQNASAITPPLTEQRPGRLRRFLRRAVYIVGGAVVVGVDAASAVHGVPAPIVEASVQVGAGLVIAGMT